MKTKPHSSCRRASIYLLTVSACLAVSVLAVGGMLSARGQYRASGLSDNAVAAQLAARSGLELARNWINSDSNWRNVRTSGTWASNVRIGGASVSLDVVDLIDGDLSNRPYDPVTVTSTARVGGATQSMSVTLVASPTAMPVLAYAMHTNGQLRVKTAGRLLLGTATASTNGELVNNETIEGSVTAAMIGSRGVVYGDVTTTSTARTSPGMAVIASYTKLATTITPGNNTQGTVLGPGYNPYGVVNADGIYLIKSSSDVTLKHCRVLGTLIISCPGRKVILDGSALLQPMNVNFPTLIVDGDLELRFSSSAALSEATAGVNLNPAGVPYAGQTDTDTTDTYPSEIQGLIHCSGTVSWTGDNIVRGAVIAESTASSDAIAIDNPKASVVYDRSLFTSPPQFYTSRVQMIPQANSLRQVVR